MRSTPLRTRWLVLAMGLLVPLVACSSDDGADGADQVESSDSADVASQLPDRAAEFVDAVFRVETEGCGWIGSGSGFAIDAHHVVTNHHVVANDSSPVVRTQSGKELHGRVIGSTERPDLAVIRLEDTLATTVSWADTNAIRPAEGLVVMGFPVPDRTFKISTGEVVAFQPPNTREALIANNPIDRGNSGGPALRRDGTVAGVVTEMATRDDDGKRVAIVFTSNAVRRMAERFIASPTDVLSSCGLGPDYVPEVPTDFDLPPIGDIPAPPAQPDAGDLPDVFTPSSLGTVPTSQPGPSSTLAPCPIEPVAVRADVAQVEAEPAQGDRWRIDLLGSVGNNASTPIEVQRIDVQLADGRLIDSVATPSVNPLSPGGTTTWSGQPVLVQTTAPVPTGITLRWTYVDGAYRHCATPAAVWPIEVTAQSQPTTSVG